MRTLVSLGCVNSVLAIRSTMPAVLFGRMAQLVPYGHMDHPCKPKYNFLREVDFCASSLLAVRRKPFLQVGGFDTRYAVFEYAAAHLSFAFREKGWRTVYQPGVVAWGGRTWAGGKVIEDVDRLAFFWRPQLASQPQIGTPVQHVFSRCSRRHALVMDVVMITPDQDSGSLANVQFACRASGPCV